MNSLGSVGDVTADVSNGVGGTEEDGVGIGREGKLFGGAIGRVNERRFEFREVVEVERAERVSLCVSLVAERGDIAAADSNSVSVCFPSREDRACCSFAAVPAILSSTAVAVAAAAAEELDEAKMASSEEEAAGLEEPLRRHCCSKAI